MKKRSIIKDIAKVGLMVAFIEAAKFALAGIPNVELTSFLIIMFALHFGRLTYFAIYTRSIKRDGKERSYTLDYVRVTEHPASGKKKD